MDVEPSYKKIILKLLMLRIEPCLLLVAMIHVMLYCVRCTISKSESEVRVQNPLVTHGQIPSSTSMFYTLGIICGLIVIVSILDSFGWL